MDACKLGPHYDTLGNSSSVTCIVGWFSPDRARPCQPINPCYTGRCLHAHAYTYCKTTSLNRHSENPHVGLYCTHMCDAYSLHISSRIKRKSLLKENPQREQGKGSGARQGKARRAKVVDSHARAGSTSSKTGHLW